MTIKSATVQEISTGQIKRLNTKEAQTAVSKMSEQQITKLEEEDHTADTQFKKSQLYIRGAVMGRPKKEIKREIISIRVPSDAITKIKSLGAGWSTRVGDALARMASEGLL